MKRLLEEITISFLIAIYIIAIALKIAGYIIISWWWFVLPIGIVLFIIVVLWLYIIWINKSKSYKSETNENKTSTRDEWKCSGCGMPLNDVGYCTNGCDDY